MRSKVRRGTCLVWPLLAAAAVAAAIQALSVGYVILLALKIERAFEFVLYTDSQYASGDIAIGRRVPLGWKRPRGQPHTTWLQEGG